MNLEMSYLLLAFATVLAPMARGPSAPPQPKITGVLTIRLAVSSPGRQRGK
jgi:hypothetical protein